MSVPGKDNQEVREVTTAPEEDKVSSPSSKNTFAIYFTS